jgi:hypothetical protein
MIEFAAIAGIEAVNTKLFGHMMIITIFIATSSPPG